MVYIRHTTTYTEISIGNETGNYNINEEHENQKKRINAPLKISFPSFLDW